MQKGFWLKIFGHLSSLRVCMLVPGAVGAQRKRQLLLKVDIGDRFEILTTFCNFVINTAVYFKRIFEINDLTKRWKKVQLMSECYSSFPIHMNFLSILFTKLLTISQSKVSFECHSLDILVKLIIEAFSFSTDLTLQNYRKRGFIESEMLT